MNELEQQVFEAVEQAITFPSGYDLRNQFQTAQMSLDELAPIFLGLASFEPGSPFGNALALRFDHKVTAKLVSDAYFANDSNYSSYLALALLDHDRGQSIAERTTDVGKKRKKIFKFDSELLNDTNYYFSCYEATRQRLLAIGQIVSQNPEFSTPLYAEIVPDLLALPRADASVLHVLRTTSWGKSNTAIFFSAEQLTGNAMTYMGSDDPFINVSLNTNNYVARDHNNVLVENSGEFISREVTEKMFTPFSKSNGGIGLQVVKKLIDANNGVAYVNSQDDGEAFAYDSREGFVEPRRVAEHTEISAYFPE